MESTNSPQTTPEAPISSSSTVRRNVGVGIAAVLVVLAGIGILLAQRSANKDAPSALYTATPTASYSASPETAVGTTSASPTAMATAQVANQLIWQQGMDGWQSTQTPPTCADTLELAAPADLSKATGILYPGQTRGGNYKPHGGFRFDNSANSEITVTAPIEGFVVRGGQYLAEGEIQYTFDVMNNCGVMYRVGHFRELPSNLKALTASWPAAMENDSRTHNVNPPLFVAKGEVLATSVGIVQDKNTFFDWGVYDYRKTNAASADVAYQKAHASDKELSWHAVCWFDWLSASDEAKVRALPAGDPTSGKKSDYCS